MMNERAVQVAFRSVWAITGCMDRAQPEVKSEKVKS
jgi:hypothetical protein